MKKHYSLQFLTAITLLSLIFTGCIKDTCHRTYTYTYYVPVYETIEKVKTNIKSNAPKDIQNPGKIFIIDHYIFLNEIDKGVHIIDNSYPASPKNVAFIDIPGNMDMAVKENVLYADSYADLVTIDITNPLNVVVKKYMENVFPFRSYGNGFAADLTKKIVDWIKRDTTIIEDCGGSNLIITDASVFYMASSTQRSNTSTASVSPIGQGGSMARFALLNNYLYTVDYSDLNIFNISNGINPTFSNKVQVDYHVETIYPFKNKLFVGSNNGMFIYNVEPTPDNPLKIGEFTHVRACDPVIADDSFAFVTLHSEDNCLGFNNELDVVKLNNLVDASLAKVYNLVSPHGLSKDGNILFVCDGSAGLRIYNAADPLNLQLLQQFPDTETYDVIANNNTALVVGVDGLYQYDYSNLNNIHLVSKIDILK